MVLSILGQGFNSPHLHQFNLKNGIITKKRITVKTSNPNDNRFTKDILLRQIFQEISDEHKTNSIDDLIPNPEKTAPKKSGFLKWIFIIIFLLSVFSLWFYTVTEVTQQEEAANKAETYTLPQNDPTIQPQEEPEKREMIEESDTIQLSVETPAVIEDSKTEREKAKEALLLQMQN